MKKISVLIIILLIPFILRPRNVIELYEPFRDDQLLLISAIRVVDDNKSILQLFWPQQFMRLIADNYSFDFKTNLENNQSYLQIILIAYYDHKEKNSNKSNLHYVLNFAQRAIDEGSQVDNVAGYGLSALHEAVLNNNLEAVEFLVKRGSTCSTIIARKSDVHGMNALGFARFLAVKKNIDTHEIIKYLKSDACDLRKYPDL